VTADHFVWRHAAFVGRSELTLNRLETEYPDPDLAPFCSLSGLRATRCVWSALMARVGLALFGRPTDGRLRKRRCSKKAICLS